MPESFGFHSPQEAGKIFYGWIIGVEILVLIVGGFSRISKTLADERKAGLLDSNRLTPLKPSQIVIGYWFGAPLREFYMSAILAAIGLVMVLLGRLPLTLWLGTQILIASTALFLGLLAVLIGLVIQKPQNSAVVPIVLIVLLPLFSFLMPKYMLSNFLLPVYSIVNLFHASDLANASFHPRLERTAGNFRRGDLSRPVEPWPANRHRHFPVARGGAENGESVPSSPAPLGSRRAVRHPRLRATRLDVGYLARTVFPEVCSGDCFTAKRRWCPSSIAGRCCWRWSFWASRVRSRNASAWRRCERASEISRWCFPAARCRWRWCCWPWPARRCSRNAPASISTAWTIFAVAVGNLLDFFLIFVLLLEFCRLRFGRRALGFVGLWLFVLCVLPFILAGVFSEAAIGRLSLLVAGRSGAGQFARLQ